MADKIVILEDSEGNNIYPISRGLATNSVDTNAIQNGAVTSGKIDWANIWSNNDIVQTFSDSNGRTALVFGDGTLICTRRATDTINCTTEWGSSTGWYYGTNTTYFSFSPAAAPDFISEPVVSYTALTTSSTSFMLAAMNSNVPSNTNYSGRWALPSGSVGLVRPGSRSNVSVVFDIIAIGRWKA